MSLEDKINIIRFLVCDPDGRIWEVSDIRKIVEETEFLHALLVSNILLQQIGKKQIVLSNLEDTLEAIKHIIKEK